MTIEFFFFLLSVTIELNKYNYVQVTLNKRLHGQNPLDIYIRYFMLIINIVLK